MGKVGILVKEVGKTIAEFCGGKPKEKEEKYLYSEEEVAKYLENSPQTALIFNPDKIFDDSVVITTDDDGIFKAKSEDFSGNEMVDQFVNSIRPFRLDIRKFSGNELIPEEIFELDQQ